MLPLTLPPCLSPSPALPLPPLSLPSPSLRPSLPPPPTRPLSPSLSASFRRRARVEFQWFLTALSVLIERGKGVRGWEREGWEEEEGEGEGEGGRARGVGRG